MTLNTLVFKRLVLVWLLLASIPTLLLVTRNQLFPLIDLQSSLAKALYWITSTGTAPYGVATVLCMLAIAYRYLPRTLFISVLMAISLSQVISFSLNHSLKCYFKEPRPNLVFLAEQQMLRTGDDALSLDTFYQLDKQTRSQAISNALDKLKISAPQMKLDSLIHQHWEDEIGYSFPSGHTIFAATLVLTTSYYLLLAGLPLFTTVLLGWGILMGLSRMLLGMHWPQDVLFSTFLAAIISGASVLLVGKLHPLKPAMTQQPRR